MKISETNLDALGRGHFCPMPPGFGACWNQVFAGFRAGTIKFGKVLCEGPDSAGFGWAGFFAFGQLGFSHPG
jgi:hypothetical protein